MRVAWIDTVPEKGATGELGELYRQVVDPQTSELDHIMQVHSLHPAGLRVHFELYRTVMASTRGLRKTEREMIALLVSSLNGCDY